MLTIEVELLTGRFTAASHDARDEPEWPPHPQRLFSALVAVWGDADEPDAAERQALEWFEQLGPPHITCSQASPRGSTVAYVPVNDVAVAARPLSKLYQQRLDTETQGAKAEAEGDEKGRERARRRLDKLLARALDDSAKATAARQTESDETRSNGLAVLPDHRVKQARIFPTVVPDNPVIRYSWPDADGGAPEGERLDALLARVHRLGHSSTLVRCRVVADELHTATPDLVPDPAGEYPLRVAGPGSLAALEGFHESAPDDDKGPLPTRHAAYARKSGQTPTPRSALGGPWIVLAPGRSDRLPVRRTVEIATAVRNSLMAHAPEPVPELISGHVPRRAAGDRDKTAATTRPHLAVVPLPFVGRTQADGAVHGVALVLPTDTTDVDRAVLDEALEAWAADNQLTLRLGAGGLVSLDRLEDPSGRAVLRRSTWCRPSVAWATVTPIALDRHPGDLASSRPARRDRAEAAARATIAAACAHLGLPQPVEIEVDQASWVVAAPSVNRFPAFRTTNGPKRALVHARLRFADPVAGPVVLGAGRYRGLGLCRPADATLLRDPGGGS